MLRFVAIVCLWSFLSLEAKPLNVKVDSEAAILINADTGAVLYEKNSRVPYFPASTTKVATAYYALHLGKNKLDTIVTADRESLASIAPDAKKRSNYTLPAYWLETDSTHIGVKRNEQMQLRDLMNGMMVASGNDAANLIARELSGSIPNFMQGLNNFLKECGCTQTQFYNPHGLHHPKHVTTAADMALIASKAMKDPVFREIVKNERFVRPKTNIQESIKIPATNAMLRKGKTHYYAKSIGIKTGYTSDAKHTFVAAAKSGKRTLIAVLFKNSTRPGIYADTIKLFEAAFNETKVERQLVSSGPQPHVLEHPGATNPITTYVAEPASIRYYPAEEPTLNGVLQWKEISFPIQKGQVVGEIQIKNNNGTTIGAVPLLAQEDVSATWSYWLQSFF